MKHDMELLREYADSNAEDAFSALVSRHIDLVYSVALRQVRDPHLAQEVAQAVFIILARKAKSLKSTTILPGWLCRTAAYASADAQKIQRRRQLREQEACMESISDESELTNWSQVMPALNEALSSLRQKEQDAIVLRYLEGKEFREVGLILGVGEDTARMRVNRGVDKLRRFFRKRGFAVSAAFVASILATHTVHAAPVGMAQTVSAIAVTKGAAISASTLSVVHSTIKMMTWFKMKLGLIGASAVLAGISVVVGLSKLTAVQPPVTRPASMAEIEQLFSLATTKSNRSLIEADIITTTTPWTPAQVQKSLAVIERSLASHDPTFEPDKGDWRTMQSNAIVRAQSGKQIVHVREWASGTYYRTDRNEEDSDIERFLREHPNEYFETWCSISNAPFSEYASFKIHRELRSMTVSKKDDPFVHDDLWRANRFSREVADALTDALVDRKSIRRNAVANQLQLDRGKAEQLHEGTATNLLLTATNDRIDGFDAVRFHIEGTPIAARKNSPLFGQIILDVWIGQVAGKAVCFKETLTNSFLADIRLTSLREKYNRSGFPAEWTTRRESPWSEIRQIVFKKVDLNPAFRVEEAFSAAFPAGYYVDDTTDSGYGKLLQNPHPEIPIYRP